MCTHWYYLQKHKSTQQSPTVLTGEPGAFVEPSLNTEWYDACITGVLILYEASHGSCFYGVCMFHLSMIIDN